MHSMKFSLEISAITPSVSMTISSSNVLALLFSNKYSSPQACAFEVTVMPDLAFFKLPSIITTIF